MSDMYCVGLLAKVLDFSPSKKITFFGAVPWSPMVFPATLPVVNTEVILSAFLMRLVSMPLRLPVGTSLPSWKYSESSRSKLLGAVMARFITSSVVTATYWILILPPTSFSNFSAMSLSWLTAVPR